MLLEIPGTSPTSEVLNELLREDGAVGPEAVENPWARKNKRRENQGNPHGICWFVMKNCHNLGYPAVLERVLIVAKAQEYHELLDVKPFGNRVTWSCYVFSSWPMSVMALPRTFQNHLDKLSPSTGKFFNIQGSRKKTWRFKYFQDVVGC
jgi:hypothetical protein